MVNFNDKQIYTPIHLIERINLEISLSGSIQTAALLDEENCVLLTADGKVLRLNFNTKEFAVLFETNPDRGVQYQDGGFDVTAPATFYIMDDIIVLVNDYKAHGFVLNMQENYLLHLQREDYYLEFSRYPIALFKDAQNVLHLIFSTAWNHLQIVNLATRQVLTADKSLIEEGAEERHLEFYQTYKEENKLLWPRAYDYFFGQLQMSPDKRKFLSAGWVWGSFESHTLYDVTDFLTNRRIRYTQIFLGEYLGRTACFVNDATIAIPYNPSLDDGESDDSTTESFWTILLCDLEGREIARVTPKEPWNLGAAELFYCDKTQSFYIFSEEIGLAVVALDGSIRLHHTEFVPQVYAEQFHGFLKYQQNQIWLYQIE